MVGDERDGCPAPLCRHTGGQRLQTAGREVAPALGLAWANCITQRLFLSRCPAAAAADPGSHLGANPNQGRLGAGDAGAPPAQPILRCIQVRTGPLSAANNAAV